MQALFKLFTTDIPCRKKKRYVQGLDNYKHHKVTQPLIMMKILNYCASLNHDNTTPKKKQQLTGYPSVSVPSQRLMTTICSPAAFFSTSLDIVSWRDSISIGTISTLVLVSHSCSVFWSNSTSSSFPCCKRDIDT